MDNKSNNELNNSQCQNCPYVRELEKRVDKLEGSMEGVQKDISEIRVGQAETKQQITTIFNTLKRIEESVEKISIKLENSELLLSNKLEKQIESTTNEIKTQIINQNERINKLELKPGTMYDKFKFAIITALCSGSIGLILGYIFRK